MGWVEGVGCRASGSVGLRLGRCACHDEGFAVAHAGGVKKTFSGLRSVYSIERSSGPSGIACEHPVCVPVTPARASCRHVNPCELALLRMV